MERLTVKADERLRGHGIKYHRKSFKIDSFDVLNKLGEYEDLEEQGLLLRLPCKVGDTVYIVGDKYPAFIETIVITEDNHIMFEFVEFYRSYEITEVWDSGGFESEDIGKTVFLTKEEAEAKAREKVGAASALKKLI